MTKSVSYIKDLGTYVLNNVVASEVLFVFKFLCVFFNDAIFRDVLNSHRN